MSGVGPVHRGQGADIGGIKSELNAIAGRAIAKARADKNVYAFEAAV